MESKMKKKKKKNQNEKIKLVEEFKNNILQPNFETLVIFLTLYCCCGENLKYELLSKTCSKRKQEHGC